jgi:Mg-chelatase subunit ChlD
MTRWVKSVMIAYCFGFTQPLNSQIIFKGLKENLGPGINNSGDQIAPFFSRDGKYLYFAQNSQPEGYYEIWETAWGSGGFWQPATLKVNLQSQVLFNQTVFGSFENNWFLINGRFPVQNGMVVYEKGFSWYQATVPAFNPQKTLPLEIEGLETMMKAGFANIFFHPQKKVLLLSLPNPDKRDLFISFPADTTTWPILKWQKPVRLPEGINSKSEESCPFLDESGRILYFSSNRPGGYGSDDIYVSFALSEDLLNWTEPKNIGFGVNSNFSDLYYNAPANHPYAYFVSYKHSMGAGDIFRIAVPDSIPVPDVLVGAPKPGSALPQTGLGAPSLVGKQQQKNQQTIATEDTIAIGSANTKANLPDYSDPLKKVSVPNPTLSIKPGQLSPEEFLPNNLTLLLDKSVSMAQSNRIELLRKSAFLLLEKLRYLDKVGLVTFGEKSQVVYATPSFQEPAPLLKLIESLKPDEGETFINEGIQKAMTLSLEQYIAEGNNEIMIITDGYFSIASRTMELIQKNPHIKISFVLVDAGTIESNIKSYISRQLPTATVLTLTNNKKDEDILLEHIKKQSAIQLD